MADARRTVRLGALTALVGTLLSGPIGLGLVHWISPQPEWRDAQTFVTAFHRIQEFPFFAGFLLIIGFVVLIAGLHAGAWDRSRARSTAALVLTAAFAAIIGINYIMQTTFVPGLVRSYSAEQAPVLAAVTMANPGSLAWALEMWGYAALGAATWLCAFSFVGGRLARATRYLFFANGPLSIGAAIAMALWPGWVLTAFGLFAFVAWNALVIAMTALAIAAAKRLPALGQDL